MKIAILGDIHGNLEALEAVLIAVGREGANRVICLGDIVGYGPDPLGCIYRLQEVEADLVLGNHDQAILFPEKIRSFNPFARPSLLHAHEIIGVDERSFLKKSTMQLEMDGAIFSHANPIAPEEWEPLFMHRKISWCMDHLEHTMAFVGHTHHAMIHCKMRSRTLALTSSTVAIGPHQYLVNPGSVGQPRDGDWRASYALWDLAGGYVELQRVEYAVKRTKEKMLNLGYPDFTAQRLVKGL
jgi:predicted phosphodiesterase